MARLPIQGADRGIWGDILNDFLSQVHNPDGTLKSNTVTAAQVQDGTITLAKLSGSVQSAIAAQITGIVADKNWVITGPINVAAGEVDYIAPAYLAIPSGFTATLNTVRARINSGTSVNLRVTQNGSTMSGLSSIVATTSGTSQTGLSLTLSDGDLIAPVVNSTSGSPQNMTVMISYTLIKT